MENLDKEKAWPILDIGMYGRPCFGERVSGDLAFAEQKDEWVFLAIVDGLGHGKRAYHIAQKAKEYFSEEWSPDVSKTILKLHEKLHGTDGAAVGLALLNLEKRILYYVGIGNTVIRRFGYSPARLFSSEGVVGVRMRSPNEQKMEIENFDIILLYTDGVSEGFELREIPQIRTQSAGLAAKNIVRKFGSHFDDSTCLVIKVKNEI